MTKESDARRERWHRPFLPIFGVSAGALILARMVRVNNNLMNVGETIWDYPGLMFAYATEETGVSLPIAAVLWGLANAWVFVRRDRRRENLKVAPEDSRDARAR